MSLNLKAKEGVGAKSIKQEKLRGTGTMEGYNKGKHKMDRIDGKRGGAATICKELF